MVGYPDGGLGMSASSPNLELSTDRRRKGITLHTLLKSVVVSIVSLIMAFCTFFTLASRLAPSDGSPSSSSSSPMPAKRHLRLRGGYISGWLAHGMCGAGLPHRPAPHIPCANHPEIYPPQRRWFVAPAIPPLARDTCWKLSPGRGRIISRLSPPHRRRASWRPTGVRPLNVAPLPQAWSPPVRRLAPGRCRRPRRSRALLGEAPVTPGLLVCACPAGVGASAACSPHPAPL